MEIESSTALFSKPAQARRLRAIRMSAYYHGIIFGRKCGISDDQTVTPAERRRSMSRLGVIKLCAESLWNALLLFLLPFPAAFDTSTKLKMLLCYIVINLLAGRYRHKALLIWDEVRLITVAWIGLFFVDLILLPLHPFLWSTILWLVLYLLISLAGVLLINRYAHLIFWPFVKENVLIVGTGSVAQAVYDVCRHNRFSLLDVRAFVQLNPSRPLDLNAATRKRVPVYPLSSLEKVIDRKRITTVLVALNGLPSGEMRRLLRRINRKVEKVKYIPLLEEQINFSSTIEDFDGQLMISTSSGPMTKPQKYFKRAVDLLASIPGLLILLPMTAYVWYVNRKSGDKGPIFFVQERIGKDGKLFKLYKYRSMIMNADAMLEEMMAKDPKIRETYQKNKKLENDPRITPAWKELRKRNIDEFPQFINVFKGDMSLIGPRPYLPREKEDMGDTYEEIIQTKPGITGMWQTHGRSSVDFDRRLELDSYYFHNWSTWLDLTLLVRTIKLLLSKDDGTAM